MWFDQERMALYTPEDLETYEKSYHDLKQLVQNEVDAGIPYNRIVLGIALNYLCKENDNTNGMSYRWILNGRNYGDAYGLSFFVQYFRRIYNRKFSTTRVYRLSGTSICQVLLKIA